MTSKPNELSLDESASPEKHGKVFYGTSSEPLDGLLPAKTFPPRDFNLPAKTPNSNDVSHWRHKPMRWTMDGDDA